MAMPIKEARDYAHLQHFESVQDKAITAREFVNWLEDQYDIRLDFDYCSPDNPAPLDLNTLIDQWLEIDKVAVERARRELLRQARQANRMSALEYAARSEQTKP